MEMIATTKKEENLYSIVKKKKNVICIIYIEVFNVFVN